jgi:transposase-like protein
MQGSDEKLSRKQEQAIAALLSEATVAAAAEKTGVNEVTIYRWLKLPDFLAAYRKARREVVEKAVAQLQQSSWAASTTLVRLLGSSSDSIRLRAAQTILDQANKGIELLDFEERLSALEEQSGDTR